MAWAADVRPVVLGQAVLIYGGRNLFQADEEDAEAQELTGV